MPSRQVPAFRRVLLPQGQKGHGRRRCASGQSPHPVCGRIDPEPAGPGRRARRLAALPRGHPGRGPQCRRCCHRILRPYGLAGRTDQAGQRCSPQGGQIGCGRGSEHRRRWRRRSVRSRLWGSGEAARHSLRRLGRHLAAGPDPRCSRPDRYGGDPCHYQAPRGRRRLLRGGQAVCTAFSRRGRRAYTAHNGRSTVGRRLGQGDLARP